MFETSAQHLWIEDNWEEVNTVDFFKVKQNGHWLPKNLPSFPFLIGKCPN